LKRYKPQMFVFKNVLGLLTVEAVSILIAFRKHSKPLGTNLNVKSLMLQILEFCKEERGLSF